MLIDQAIKKTPSLFEPLRLHVEILLKDGNKSKAGEALEILRQMVDSHVVFDRRFNYRYYLVTASHYYAELGQFNEAKKLYNDPEIFTNGEKIGAIREIEIIESFLKHGKGKYKIGSNLVDARPSTIDPSCGPRRSSNTSQKSDGLCTVQARELLTPPTSSRRYLSSRKSPGMAQQSQFPASPGSHPRPRRSPIASHPRAA